MRKITINLSRDGATISYETLDVATAKIRLATKMANRYHYVIDPADYTGAIEGDDVRYAADCAACRITD